MREQEGRADAGDERPAMNRTAVGEERGDGGSRGERERSDREASSGAA